MNTRRNESGIPIATILIIFALIVGTAAPTLAAGQQPPASFLISGHVFYENGSDCNNPNVNITNLNSGTMWQAETYAGSNRYQLTLCNDSDIIVDQILQFNATSPDGGQIKVTTQTITQQELNDGGLFNFNISLAAMAMLHDINVSTDYQGAVNGIKITDDETVIGPDENLTSGKAYNIRYKLVNEGDFNETSIAVTVKAFNESWNETIGTHSYSLNTGISKTYKDTWNTSGLSPDEYNITVNASIPDDANPDDNKRTRAVTLETSQENTPPWWDSIPDQTIAEDTNLTLNLGEYVHDIETAVEYLTLEIALWDSTNFSLCEINETQYLIAQPKPDWFGLSSEFQVNATDEGLLSNTSNVFYVNVTALPLEPDLIPTVLTIPANMFANQSSVINATIENIGGGDASSFNVSMTANGTLVDKVSVGSLSAAASEEVSFAWTPASAETYVLCVVADCDGAIDEADETNNETCEEVVVKEKQGTLSCTCGDVCVNKTGWWHDEGIFNASSTPIQDAIDNSIAGDTICVKDGTYNESVDVDMQLTIKSENGSTATIVKSESSSKNVFKVTANWVNLSGFTVTGATGGYSAGIRINDDINYCNITNNNVTGNKHGIYLRSGCENNVIKGNEVTSNTAHGLYLRGTLMNPCYNNTLEGNLITLNTENGIYLYDYCNNNTIEGNTVSNNDDNGICWRGYSKGCYNGIKENTITMNGEHGIHVLGDSNTIEGNTVSSNGQSGTSDGIYVEGNSNTIEENDVISNTGHGVEIYQVTKNEIKGNNVISNGKHGIYLGMASCTDNSVVENTVSSNSLHGIYLSSTTSNIITDNTVSNNTCTGIYFKDADDNNVTCNLVLWNEGVGFNLTGGSTGNNISYNNIVFNGVYNVTTESWKWNLHNLQSDGITAENNYWGTANSSMIAASIKEDTGTVDYLPFATEPVPCAPEPPVATYEVMINEFEQNPSDTDSGNEWVELYNNGGTALNISGWKLINGGGKIISIPVSTEIAANGYWVTNWTNGSLVNSNENITLYDAAGSEVDKTLTATDTENDDRCWARVPNGYDTGSDTDWKIQEYTRNASNNLYNVSITSEPAEQKTAPDKNATYTLTVTNNGNVADTMKLNITENEAGFGALSADTFALNAGENATAYLNVSNPTSGIYNTTVRAISQGNPSVFDDVSVRTNVTAPQQAPPVIIYWYNNKTYDNSTEISVNESEAIFFNTSANQTIDTWHWLMDGVEQVHNYCNFTTSWTAAGQHEVSVYGENENGETNTIVWNVTVLPFTERPVIEFIQPTPENGTEVTVDLVLINVTVASTHAIDTVLLNWNGVNETMYAGGDTYFYSNKADLSNGDYIYRVYASDICGNWGVSETRLVSVNVTPTEVATISIGDATASPGETTTVLMRIYNATNAGVINVDLTYNQSIIRVIDVAGGDFDITFANLEHNDTGIVSIGAFQAENHGLNGTVTIANVTLEAVGSYGHSSPLEISVNEFKDATPEANDLQYEVSNGTFYWNGDANGDGDVTLFDATYLAQSVLGITGYEAIAITSDVNGDGVVTLADAMYLAKHVLGIPGYEKLK